MLGTRYGINKRPKEEGEKPFWISFADLMTALMTLFLVVMAVSLMIVTQKINEATHAENTRKADIAEICQQIKLKAAMEDKVIDVDCSDNRINFGEAGRFNHNDYKLNAAGANALQSIVPIILEAATTDKGQKWMKQIVIEGFTDTDGSYLYNLHLSLQRSEWVMCSLLDDKLSTPTNMTDKQRMQIRQLFLAGGVSFNSAKESKEASRRVELRLQFYGSAEANSVKDRPDFIINKAENCQLQ